MLLPCSCPTRRTGSCTTAEASSYNFSADNDVHRLNFRTTWSFDCLENERAEQKQPVIFLGYEPCQQSHEIISFAMLPVSAPHITMGILYYVSREKVKFITYHPYVQVVDEYLKFS